MWPKLVASANTTLWPWLKVKCSPRSIMAGKGVGVDHTMDGVLTQATCRLSPRRHDKQWPTFQIQKGPTYMKRWQRRVSSRGHGCHRKKGITVGLFHGKGNGAGRKSHIPNPSNDKEFRALPPWVMAVVVPVARAPRWSSLAARPSGCLDVVLWGGLFELFL